MFLLNFKMVIFVLALITLRGASGCSASSVDRFNFQEEKDHFLLCRNDLRTTDPLGVKKNLLEIKKDLRYLTEDYDRFKSYGMWRYQLPEGEIDKLYERLCWENPPGELIGSSEVVDAGANKHVRRHIILQSGSVDHDFLRVVKKKIDREINQANIDNTPELLRKMK